MTDEVHAEVSNKNLCLLTGIRIAGAEKRYNDNFIC